MAQRTKTREATWMAVVMTGERTRPMAEWTTSRTARVWKSLRLSATTAQVAEKSQAWMAW